MTPMPEDAPFQGANWNETAMSASHPSGSDTLPHASAPLDMHHGEFPSGFAPHPTKVPLPALSLGNALASIKATRSTPSPRGSGDQLPLYIASSIFGVGTGPGFPALTSLTTGSMDPLYVPWEGVTATSTSAGTSLASMEVAPGTSIPNNGPKTSPKIDEKYSKTHLCRFYAVGRCKRGTKCTFAHGDRDLRVRPDLWKTSMCHKFTRRCCPLPATECRHAHGKSELRVAP